LVRFSDASDRSFSCRYQWHDGRGWGRLLTLRISIDSFGSSSPEETLNCRLKTQRTYNALEIELERIRTHMKSSARILLLSLPGSSTSAFGGSGGGSAFIF